MRSRGTLLSLALVLFGSVKDFRAQDYASSDLSSDQAIAIEHKDFDLKQTASVDQTQTSERQNWLFHVQATEVGMGQPGFRSPYKGTNSIPPDDDFRQTSTFDLLLDLLDQAAI